MHIKSSQSDQMAGFCLALPVTSEELAVLPGQVSLSAGHPGRHLHPVLHRGDVVDSRPGTCATASPVR